MPCCVCSGASHDSRKQIQNGAHHDLRYSTCGQTAEVIHHRIGTPFTVGTFTAVCQNDVFMVSHGTLLQTNRKTLHKGTIQSMLPHPAEMPQHRLSPERAKHCCGLATGELKAGGEQLFRRKLRNIRPKIHADIFPARESSSDSLPNASIRGLRHRLRN